MAKNFASIYATGNDSVALEQKIFVKTETTRGQLIAPTGADFIYQLAGGAVTFNRPVESSPIRSGRHHTSVIEQKDVTNWSFPMLFMIDESFGSFNAAMIDPALRVLFKSLLGFEDTSGQYTYNSSTPPDLTFSIFENGDLWAHQMPGGFVDSANLTFPGDGQSQGAWAGMGKTVYVAGIAKSTTDNNAGNAVTLVSAAEADRFEVGCMVMLIEANGTTRSADTPDGSPRTVTAINGADLILSGAILADADGSGPGAPIYVCYYEPATPVAINNPLTGLVGDVTIGGLSVGTCVRNLGLNIVNNHEAHNFCWGERGLSGPLFTPGGRLSVEVTAEINMSHKLLEFIKNLKDFDGVAINLTLGEAAGRRMELSLPKVVFAIPEISVPETGTIPVSFSGLAYQTALDQADEITVEFK